MFYFKGTRRPDFKNIARQNIYKNYWQNRNVSLRGKLMEREVIFFNWIKPNSKVLSLGCGNSRLFLELKNKKQCQVLGVDIEESIIKLLNENNISGVVADITKNDFNLEKISRQMEIDLPFDYMIMSEFLEHLAMPENLIQKIKEYTKYLILSIPNSAFYRYRLGFLFCGRFFTQWANHPSEHLRFWSHIDFLDWLRAFNLKVEKTQASNGPFLKNIWPNMFGHQICYLVRK